MSAAGISAAISGDKSALIEYSVPELLVGPPPCSPGAKQTALAHDQSGSSAAVSCCGEGRGRQDRYGYFFIHSSSASLLPPTSPVPRGPCPLLTWLKQRQQLIGRAEHSDKPAFTCIHSGCPITHKSVGSFITQRPRGFLCADVLMSEQLSLGPKNFSEERS